MHECIRDLQRTRKGSFYQFCKFCGNLLDMDPPFILTVVLPLGYVRGLHRYHAVWTGLVPGHLKDAGKLGAGNNISSTCHTTRSMTLHIESSSFCSCPTSKKFRMIFCIHLAFSRKACIMAWMIEYWLWSVHPSQMRSISCDTPFIQLFEIVVKTGWYFTGLPLCLSLMWKVAWSLLVT